ncbi:hypothetical protein QTI33_15020 [Variovorax sp. J22P271]|uniref:hypothetical protein n=1 Tax=Variovorax davisae TaxID=3053515 RepID=UPI0025767316|nr:hypothetical protein [Variovorax sp. J22P271]MDM0033446.1 hypothetical protein [Variovorax sp. J22P271]
MNELILEQETVDFRGSGGVSADNRSVGFRPAFRNMETGSVYPSCFADGRPAPIHMVDGLPDELVVARSAAGKVVSVKDSVQSGFVFNGRFYDRGEAAKYLRTNPRPAAALTVAI